MKFIECPNCKTRYYIQEIFNPDYLLGKPKYAKGTTNIIGEIDQDLVEEFTCNNCNKHFKVEAEINFKTSVMEEESFDDAYVTPIGV